jgi:hypothetical protein
MALRGMKGKNAGKFDENLSYLNRLSEEVETRRCNAGKAEDFLNLDLIDDAL